MGNMKIIRLIDRTRTTTDWKCPRARYYGYEYQGRGIVKTGTSLPLFMGTLIHDATAAIGTFTQRGEEVPIDAIADAARTEMRVNLIEAAKGVIEKGTMEFAYEQAALTEGIIRGFYKHVWPRLMAMYPKIIAVEQEMEYSLFSNDGLEIVFMTKPDILVEDANGELVYIEYKSTSSKQDKWIQSWDTAVQLHSSVMATEATIGRRPSYVQIVGMYKGYESYGKQSSPFCYAYKRSGNPPFTTDQIQYDYKAGYRRFATWELTGGVKEWVEGMPENILANQFPLTAPIMVNESLVNDFFRQRLSREREIEYFHRQVDAHPGTTEQMMNQIFPQKFDQCVPSFGWPCEYRKLCHGQVTDPLEEGYELRTPHHARELEAMNDAE